MNNRSEITANQLEHRILFLTVVIVSVLGFFVWWGLVSPPDLHTTLFYAERVPASEVSLEVAVRDVAMTSESEVLTIRLDCMDEKVEREIESRARHLRLTGKWCGAGDLARSEVLNHGNGIVGTTFVLPGGGFSSDYIDLAEGDNKIVVKVYGKNDKSRMAQLLVRRPKPLQP